MSDLVRDRVDELAERWRAGWAGGGTVTWVNDDSVGHDVTKSGGPGPDFSSGEPGAMAAGDTFDHKFEAAGKIDYVCTVHPGMKGTVTVK